MKAISIHGPWAYYERTLADQEAQIKQLKEELAHHKEDAQQARETLQAEQEINKEHLECSMPALQNVIDEAQARANQLEQQLQQTREQAQQAEQAAASAYEAAMTRMQQLLEDNLVLKSELHKTMHVSHATSTKIDEVRRHMGLGKEEAEAFVKDLDGTKAANKALQVELASLAADKAHLQQQCDNRSAHALTLISENKRLSQQVSEVRQQMAGMDQDLWRARQDLAAAQKVGAKITHRKEAAAAKNQARPQWQGLRKALPKQDNKGNEGATTEAVSEGKHSRQALETLYTALRPSTAPSQRQPSRQTPKQPFGVNNKQKVGAENTPPAVPATDEELRKKALEEVLQFRKQQQQNSGSAAEEAEVQQQGEQQSLDVSGQEV